MEYGGVYVAAGELESSGKELFALQFQVRAEDVTCSFFRCIRVLAGTTSVSEQRTRHTSSASQSRTGSHGCAPHV